MEFFILLSNFVALQDNNKNLQLSSFRTVPELLGRKTLKSAFRLCFWSHDILLRVPSPSPFIEYISVDADFLVR